MVSRVNSARLAQPVPKPLLRRSTLSGTIRKFDETDLGADDSFAPASPAKRARVTFNPDVEEKVIEEYSAPGRSLSAVKKEVKRAIDAHKNGDSEAYDGLKDIFKARHKFEEDDADMGTWYKDMRTFLIALASYAPLLDKKCNSLVNSILKCDWIGREEEFVLTYVHFLSSLASAQGTWVELMLKVLIEMFHGIKLSSGRLPGCPTVSREQMTTRLHKVIERLINVVPSAAANCLLPLLGSQFPFADQPKKLYSVYIENLLRLITYAVPLKSDVYALITDRLVKMDVQMQLDLDADDDIADAVVQALSENASHEEEEEGEEDSDDSDAESVTSEDSLSGNTKRVKELQENVEKMDYVLDRLFTMYEPHFRNPKSSQAISMYELLTAHFTNIILPTYRSRHTQFLLFHFAQTDENFIDHFLGTCAKLAFDKSRPSVLRQSAAAYLASFVARGAHVPAETVRSIFELFGSHLDHIRNDQELTCRGPDLQRYTLFYAMTQALIYIFCFRWRDLIESTEIFEEDDPIGFVGQDLNWYPGIKETLSRTIYSKFNPMKICSPLIVSQFAKTANHLKFIYIYPLLESNKRIRLSQFVTNGSLRDTGSSKAGDSYHQLDAYFPFDPYQLPVSKRWVEDDYVQWRGLPGLKEDEDDDEDSDEEDDDEEEEDTATESDDE